MSNYQHLIGSITHQCHLLSASPFQNGVIFPTTEVLTELANRYTAACQEVNSHLQTCAEWISSAEESEAVRYAEIFQVLENYNVLNFSLLHLWVEQCRNLNLKLLPLDSHHAKVLSQARNRVDASKKYLEKHRLLALQQAPLADRLYILHILVAMLPTEPWFSMVHEFEVKRFEEMKRELYILTQPTTSTTPEPTITLDALDQELTKIRWYNPIPSELSQGIARLKQNAYSKKIIQDLEQLIEQLSNAYYAQDVENVRIIIQQWEKYLTRNHLSSAMIPTSLHQALQAPLAWLDEQERQIDLEVDYDQKLRHLERTLSSDKISDLVAAYHSLTITAELAGIPLLESTNRAYKHQVLLLDRQKKQKARAITFVSIAFLAILGLIIVWGTNAIWKESRVRNDASNIAAALNDYEQNKDPQGLVQARMYIDHLQNQSTDISSPKIRDQIAKYESFVAVEKRRVADFFNLQQTIQEAIANQQPNPVLLPRLSALANTDSEKITYQKLKAEHDRIEKTVQKKRDDDYLAILNELIVMEEKIQKFQKTQQLEKSNAFKMMYADFQRLDSIAKGVKPEFITRRDDLKLKTDVLYAQLQKDMEVFRDFAKLAEFIGDDTQYRTYLGELAISHANTQDGQEAKTVSDSFEGHTLLTEWNSFIEKESIDWKSWGSIPTRGKAVLATFEALREKIAFVPEYDSLTRHLESLKPLLDKGGRLKIASDFTAFFQRNGQGNFSFFRTDHDNYYYFKERPIATTKNDDLIVGQYLTNQRDTATKSINLTKEELEQVREAAPAKIVKLVDERLTPLLDKLDTDGWIIAVEEILRQLDPKNTDRMFDRLVQAIFLTEALNIVCLDPLFTAELQPWKNYLTEYDGFDRNINWLNPTTENIKAQRNTCSTMLANMPNPPLAARLAKITPFTKEKNADFQAVYRWCGFMDRDGVSFICRFSEKKSWPDGSLWVVNHSAESKKTELIKVGQYKEGTGQVTSQHPDLLRGMPVYLLISELNQATNRR